MRDLLTAARKVYQYIIIDFSPLVPSVDAKAASALVDHFVFVIHWGQTRRGLVIESLQEAASVLEKTRGVLLNQADPSSVRLLESLKGKHYGSYREHLT